MSGLYLNIREKVLSPPWSRMKGLFTNNYNLAEEEDVCKYDVEDEAQRLLEELKFAKEQIKESNFYAKFKEQIASYEFQEQLKSVFVSHSKLKMIIYALGSLEFGFNPHFQLSIALLLEQDFCWIEGIEVYDPLFTSADIIVLKDLGCKVLEINEGCRRKVEEPTLFYMPYPGYMLVENLLEANWCPSQINQLIILTNTGAEGSDDDHTEQINNVYKKSISQCTTAIYTESYGGTSDFIFHGFRWYFFHVDSQVNMEALIEGNPPGTAKTKDLCDVYIVSQNGRSLAEERFNIPFLDDGRSGRIDWTDYYGRYRGPRKYRCISDPPPKGWIKLYVSGIGAEGETNEAGFGGICYNEFKEPILVYNGSFGKVDTTAACVEALKRGLSILVSKEEHIKLIVEGDNLKFIQWVNNRHELPEEICGSLCEVFDLLTKFNCVIYHIYEEANQEAICLARKGAIS